MPHDSSTPEPSTPQPAGVSQPQARRRAWSWAAILGAAVALLSPIVVIALALTLPHWFKLFKNRNEVAAINTMRAIDAAELKYKTAYPDIGFACSLATLGGDPSSGPPSAQGADLLDPALAATGHQSGYAFAISNCNQVTLDNQASYTSYQLTAVPLQVHKTGNTGFCSDESAILKADPTGGTNCTQPIQ
jgi:type IV pilus assembly protein PilA